jgi:hypothetical protein
VSVLARARPQNTAEVVRTCAASDPNEKALAQAAELMIEEVRRSRPVATGEKPPDSSGSACHVLRVGRPACGQFPPAQVDGGLDNRRDTQVAKVGGR